MISETASSACSHSMLSICTGADALDATPAQPRPLPAPPRLIEGLRADDPGLVYPAERATTPAIEMPWIWRMLRDSVYRRLPRYEDIERQMELVFAPVIVDGTYDTVPGVGIAGDF